MIVGLLTADFLPNVGGVAAHVAELARALAHLGHEVHVVAPHRKELPPVEQWQGVTVHRPRIIRTMPLYSMQLRRWLSGFIEKTHVEILHVHGMRPVDATRGAPRPVIFTNHTSGFLQRLDRGQRARQRVGKRLRHLAHVLAPSDELVSATQAVGYQGPVNFIANGVDSERFRPPTADQRATARRGLGYNADDVVVLLARRLVPKNGVTFFAEAAAHIAAASPSRPVKLAIAGDGPERAPMTSSLRDAGMLEHTNFLGSVANADMPGIYQCADISVLPSLQEATSITGLESMASGLPIVGTEVGGIPAIVDAGRTGLLVPAGAPRELGEAIRRLCDAPAERAAMGQSARERVEAEFAWPIIANRTAAVYRSVLS